VSADQPRRWTLYCSFDEVSNEYATAASGRVLDAFEEIEVMPVEEHLSIVADLRTLLNSTQHALARACAEQHGRDT
jgi:hypothetical protein